jgi:hypothetical protein
MRNEGDGGRNTGLRVVLDTNVYISIFTRPESAIFQVWTHAVHNHYELIVSPVIVGEFARVVRRDFHWDEKKVLLHVRIINRSPRGRDLTRPLPSPIPGSGAAKPKAAQTPSRGVLWSPSVGVDKLLLIKYVIKSKMGGWDEAKNGGRRQQGAREVNPRRLAARRRPWTRGRVKSWW